MKPEQDLRLSRNLECRAMMESPVTTVPAAQASPGAAGGHYGRHYEPASSSGTLPSSLRRPPAAKSQRYARHQSGGGGSGHYSGREYLFYPQVRKSKLP